MDYFAEFPRGQHNDLPWHSMSSFREISSEVYGHFLVHSWHPLNKNIAF